MDKINNVIILIYQNKVYVLCEKDNELFLSENDKYAKIFEPGDGENFLAVKKNQKLVDDLYKKSLKGNRRN